MTLIFKFLFLLSDHLPSLYSYHSNYLFDTSNTSKEAIAIILKLFIINNIFLIIKIILFQIKIVNYIILYIITIDVLLKNIK